MREVSTWIPVAVLCGAVMFFDSIISPHVSCARESRAQSSAAAATVTQGTQSEGQPSSKGQETTPQTEAPVGFTVDKFLVEGNTLLETEKIDAILAKYKRSGLTIKDIEQAKN